jgi:hypothetical protein
MITKTDSGSRSAPSIGVSLSPASMGRFLLVGQFEILAYNPRDHQADQTYDKYDNAWLGETPDIQRAIPIAMKKNPPPVDVLHSPKLGLTNITLSAPT